MSQTRNGADHLCSCSVAREFGHVTTPNCSEDGKCSVGGQLLWKKGRTDFRRQQAISAINSNVCGDRKLVCAER